MNTKQLTKKRIVIVMVTSIIGGSFLIICWFLLPENIFVLVLVGGAVIASIVEYFVFGRKEKSN